MDLWNMIVIPYYELLESHIMDYGTIYGLFMAYQIVGIHEYYTGFQEKHMRPRAGLKKLQIHLQ